MSKVPALQRRELADPCESCTPTKPDTSCPTCGGLGVTWTDPRTIAESSDLPEHLAVTLEVLQARAAISRYGVDGWMALYRVEPSECLATALEILDGELTRLQHAAAREKAARKDNAKGQGRR